MTSSYSDKQDEIREMASDLNNELAYSLSTLSQLKNSPNELKMANQLVKIKGSDLSAISSLAHILIIQNPDETTDGQIASKLLKELSNSHPNRILKTLSKKMVKRKWGEKHEAK